MHHLDASQHLAEVAVDELEALLGEVLAGVEVVHG
jgi:hypothetical protein